HDLTIHDCSFVDNVVGRFIRCQKLFKHPPCVPTEVQFDNNCEVCTRPEQNGVCDPGYKCSDVAAGNQYFYCYYTRINGWEEYSNQYNIAAWETANHSGPLPLISAICVYQRNQTGKTAYGYPALNVNVNVPYLLLRSGVQEDVAPKSMRMVFSSVEHIEHRDSYYYDHHITRFFRFDNYRPTTHDLLNPKQLKFKCLTGLDICGAVRVYRIQLTAYAPNRSLYIEQNFTATTYMGVEGWYPVIATAILPKNGVYVVFSPRDSPGKLTSVTYEIFLKGEDGNRKTNVSTFMEYAQKYSCTFTNVKPGTYRAQLLVKYTDLTKKKSTVLEYQSASLMIRGDTSIAPLASTKLDHDKDYVWPIVVIGASMAIACSLLLLLFWQSQNKDFLKEVFKRPRNRQDSKKKKFLLYLREAEKYVPCITQFLNRKVEVVCDKDWENEPTCPLELFKEKVKQCSHLLILWSQSAPRVMSNPGITSQTEINARSTVQDYFKEAINFSRDLSNTGDLKIVVLYIPGYADRSTVTNVGEHQIYDLTHDCKQLLKYLTEDESELNEVNDNALQNDIMAILNPPQDTVENVNEGQEETIKPLNPPCPVHFPNGCYPLCTPTQPPQPSKFPQVHENIPRNIYSRDPYQNRPQVYDPSLVEPFLDKEQEDQGYSSNIEKLFLSLISEKDIADC
ncbi:uncharacterized protein LOC132545220, partial [Ylistrum balloti]|uniref:uncharacterized protein LOC132545220 n=1 Tax=Ylistrum balloti TaxID=509963 RepID=UPI002905E59D